MSSTNAKYNEELKSSIQKSLKKINGSKENEICRYLPMEGGGYMHHFTFRKMKGECPKELIALINKHVLTPSKPQTVTPKPRAPRGSRKRTGSTPLHQTRYRPHLAHGPHGRR